MKRKPIPNNLQQGTETIRKKKKGSPYRTLKTKKGGRRSRKSQRG